MPDAYIKNLPQEDENPAGNETPPQEGNEPPTEDGNPAEGTQPPTEGTDPPQEGDNPPTEGTDPPQGGDNPPTEGTDPPQGGDNPPTEDTDPPQGGDNPPTEGTDPPQEGDTPTEGDTPAGDENTMQDILDNLRESLDRKDADVESLTESIRSLTDIMSAKLDTSVTDLPFNGWRDWRYPVRMDFTVHPLGAGYDMEQSERVESPEALLARYNEILSLCNDGGSLKYFYVRYIWDDIDSDSEILVYDYEAKDEPVQDIEVPFEGWESWAYPVTVDFTVHPWGAGYDMDVTETYDTPEAFRTDYGKNVKLCGDGGTLKDYRIRRITDSGGITVYDGEVTEEPPAEDLTPAILETLQSIDARLESIDSLSANTLDHYEDTLHQYKEQNALLTNTLALNMAILFFLVVSFGHKVAHAFWQRMRVG